MDTLSFLKKVLPASGNRVLAELVPYNDKKTGESRIGWRYQTFTDLAVMAEAVAQFDEAGRTVYHACNAYGAWYEEDVRGVTRKRLRTQKNVQACRSLYDDIDIGKNGCYAEKREAVEAVKEFLAASGMPMPMVVSSGGGLHLYWPFDGDITPTEWKELAGLKRLVVDHLGLKIDHAVDMDEARVLRPVGTTNAKHGKKVKLLLDAGPYSAQQIREVLESYTSRNGLTMPRPRTESTSVPAWAQDPEYPPSSGMEIIRKCGAMQQVARSKGVVQEPLWRAMLGLVKYTVEGELLGHTISRGHDEYNYAETQEKLDAWAVGPATCAEFGKHTQACETCKYKGKLKSPIKLGYAEDIVEAKEPPIIRPDILESTPEDTAGWEDGIPDGYRWDGNWMQKRVRNADGDFEWQQFTPTPFFISLRIRNVDGTWAVKMHAREVNRTWRHFEVPTSDLAAPDTMLKTLAKYEVFVAGHKNARYHMSDALKAYLYGLQANRVEVRTYSAFGWDDENGFVIGDKRITREGVEEVLLTDSVFSSHRHDFGEAGEPEEWANLVDSLVNHPGAEPFQFVMCAAFAAPLISIIGAEDWHGIPVALVGKGGEGKTTMAQVMCSAFGGMSNFIFNSGNSGVTANARMARIAMMRNLPFVMDEITGTKPEELGDLMYAMTNGRDKDRLNSAGKPIGGSLRWDTIPFITSNASILDELSKLDAARVDPTSLRVFEISLPENYLDQVYADLPRAKNDLQRLSKAFGAAGREYLRWVATHRQWIIDAFERLQAKYNAKNQEEARERFYTYLVTTSMLAGTIATKLGLIKFDVGRTTKWAFHYMKTLRANRRAAAIDPDAYVAQFLSDLHGRLIITNHIGDRRGKGEPEAVISAPHQGAAWGRLALKDKRLLISHKAMSDWCMEHKVSPTSMRKEMDRLGYLMLSSDGTPYKWFFLGRGTNIPSGRARCYEIDFHKAISGSSLRAVASLIDGEEAAESI